MIIRDKIEGGVNIHLMRKKKGLGPGQVVTGQDYDTDLKDSDDGQMFAAQNSPWGQALFHISSLLSRLANINFKFQSVTTVKQTGAQSMAPKTFHLGPTIFSLQVVA